MFQRPCLRLRVLLQHIRAAQMSSQAEEEILFQARNHVGVVTMNRPKALNALNLSMVRKMYSKMLAWETDPNIALVVIRGAGGKAFCAGGDIRAVTDAGRKGDPLSQNFFKEEYILNHKIGSYSKPYVALIDGITMGGGVGLSVHGMFRVATEKTMFAMPETAVGLFPDVGGGHFLPQLEGKLGIYLALTGVRLRGRDISTVGIATHFVESSKLEELQDKLSSLSSSVGKEDVAAVLNDFQNQSQLDVDKEFSLKPNMEKINRLFAGDSMEAIFAALEKDGSDWSIAQLDTLKKMSPTSMKITLRLLLEGKGRSLAEDLQVEYRLSQRCVEDRDFYEGVRAVLIDKDNSPQWNPASIKDVAASKVDWYFSPLDAKRELVL
ncbi:3-hydroxyisobutyryl-CoA hydrolase, mitochondrial [Aplysia californica]|uniref:3-hydroxyisobutyryl-CoA hydrolase, mitochondrial n=1 Tax=Aplysia californica TaxID=6500 RepID=A0ABM0ZXC4_APLCA|nr:3-hydroxyisobutyryl-CoA hydrolase, mitochondrial [Aplysia californica]XP_012936440.1 3-hydroxyisobutyryl-CoA hydrolase, mitochondrial [Aplysia californica]XP_035824935.1 3-hydroxyisobutyryl-CoA hydrolase, mitochondrial [Aplysia californica]